MVIAGVVLSIWTGVRGPPGELIVPHRPEDRVAFVATPERKFERPTRDATCPRWSAFPRISFFGNARIPLNILEFQDKTHGEVQQLSRRFLQRLEPLNRESLLLGYGETVSEYDQNQASATLEVRKSNGMVFSRTL